ncbi:MAG: AAC(3) family N-acetyltransferase [Nocardioidaceae bacterium]
MNEVVTTGDVVAGLEAAGTAGRPLCVHSSLRSFGRLASGAATVVDGVLGTGATVLAPVSSFRTCMAAPPPGASRPFNSEDDGSVPAPGQIPAAAWDPAATFVDPAMGMLPAEVLQRAGCVRGDHPLSSFAALGPLAANLVAGQRPLDVFNPLRRLARLGGAVIAMGVGLDTITLLHLAEREAGLRLLRRWALTADGVVECEHGGCSRGFERLADAVAPAETRVSVGASTWRVWDARLLLTLATEAFRADPGAGTCADPACARCRDIVAAAVAGYVYPTALDVPEKSSI